MAKANGQFALSAEIECLTTVPDNPPATEAAVSQFLQILSVLTPSLPASQGIFTTYAKVYSDVGHVELALIECDDPYLLPSLFERMQILATRAVEQLAAQGTKLILANNNHSGLLSDGCPVWGDHENYLVEQHPRTFAEQILPFLVTRLYHGAGGVHYPTGNYLAAVRPTCMELATGGGTTECRAIHSTAREEHHMGSQPKRFRYHQILGDGHRSHYNLALQFGATALAIKAILFDAKLQAEIARLRSDFGKEWVAMLQKLNVLAVRGKPLGIHPLVLKTQRVYLEAARRYADTLTDAPGWISRILGDWQDTLYAYERVDRPWLAARLDAFAKYEFYSAVLEESGHTWKDLPGKNELFCELALLDHSYHEFCNPKSVFARLESAGLLRHRVARQVLPGDEPDPFVPETSTRAQVRARFIRENKGRTDLAVDWSCIHDHERQVRCLLEDPFARELGAWQQYSAASRRPSPPVGSVLRGVLTSFDFGQYEAADARLRELEGCFQVLGAGLPTNAIRYRAWLQARRGFTDGPDVLGRLYGHETRNLLEITDYCSVYRFRGLVPDLQRMEPWIRRGHEQLGNGDLETSSVFRDHVAYAMLRHGQVEGALEILRPALDPESLSQTSARVKGRILATAGEALRLTGDQRRAGRYLKQAEQIQLEHRYFGPLADITYASLAKWESTRRRALQWLAKAISIQASNLHRLGHTNSLLLEARLCDSPRRADAARTKILAHREALPALAECPLLERILDYWDKWTTREKLTDDDTEYWGL